MPFNRDRETLRQQQTLGGRVLFGDVSFSWGSGMPKKWRFRSYTFGSETIERLCQVMRMDTSLGERVRGSRGGGSGQGPQHSEGK